MRTRISPTIFILLAVLLSACGKAATTTPTAAATVPATAGPSVIIAEGRVEPVRYAELAFTASGLITDVPVKEGQAVKKGDLMVRLGDETDMNYAAAQLELATAQKALNDLQLVSGTDLAQAVIDLREAKENYDDDVDRLHDLQNDDKIPQKEARRVLVKTWRGYEYEIKTKAFKGPAPEVWIIDAQNDVGMSKAKMEAAQRNYDRLKSGVNVEQLAILEAKLTAAKAKVAAFYVTAPFDGVVAKLDAKLGNSIKAGQPAVTLADFSHWIVTTTDLTEIDVVELKETDPVIVTLDALPDVELKGTIDSISQSFGENQGDVVYEVTVMLTDTDPAMRWGMTAEVKFEQ